MVYLHESKVGSHGHLSSTNCVIDSRWTCKVTDYGLCYLRRNHLSNPQNITEDDRCQYLHMYFMLRSRIQSATNMKALDNWFHSMVRLRLKDVHTTFTFCEFYLCQNTVWNLILLWFVKITCGRLQSCCAWLLRSARSAEQSVVTSLPMELFCRKSASSRSHTASILRITVLSVGIWLKNFYSAV